VSYQFRSSGLVLVRCRIAVADEYIIGDFVLDTGAERTMITTARANSLNLAVSPAGVIWTASRRDSVQQGKVARIDALGLTHREFPVLVHDFPAGIRIDGLLGLDFFRDTNLAIDFRARTITVS